MQGGDHNSIFGGVPTAMSGDGRFLAFASDASDLVPGDGTSGPTSGSDAFVRDLQTATTTRVNVDINGGDANSGGAPTGISADGRYVVFESAATDHVPDDGNNRNDVFLRDMQTATTRRVSVDINGADANGDSSHSAISPDGRYVVFESAANDLIENDGNVVSDVFVRDMHTATTTRVSVDINGGDPNSGSGSSGSAGRTAISADGRYVVFESAASDLVPGDGNSGYEVFMRDRQTASTIRVSVDIDGGDANGESIGCSMSADGRYVAFGSRASDLVPDDGNGALGDDVFVRDMQSATTVRANVDMTGGDPSAGGFEPSISADGRFVAFRSLASDLVPGDTNFAYDIFVRDLRHDTTSRVSLDTFGRQTTQFEGHSANPILSSDGHYIAFRSAANNLVPDDGNAGQFSQDVFVRAVVTPTIDSVAPAAVARGSTGTLTVTGGGFSENVRVWPAAFGPYGITVNSVVVISETELQVSVTVDPAAPTGKRHIVVWTPGTGPGPLATGFGFCFGCLTVT